MEKNVGKNDKIIRYVLGVVIIGAGILFNSWWGILGVIPIFTAAMGWCPLYKILGTSTEEK